MRSEARGPLLFAVFGVTVLGLLGVDYLADRMKPPVPPSAAVHNPEPPPIPSAERRHRWDSCVQAQGVPVMGFDYVIVCVDGAHVLAIDGKKF